MPWARWFVDGRINLTVACVDRWARGGAGARPALIAESETGAVRMLTYAELAAEVDRVAAALTAEGFGHGDAAGVFLPMVPEAVIAAYAIAKLGRIYLPIFSGLAPSAVAARLQDAGATVLFTADGTWRRGRQGLMKPVADEAVAECPTVQGLWCSRTWAPR